VAAMQGSSEGGHGLSPRAAIGIALAGLLVLFASAGAAASDPDSGVKVAPGVYLASASELAGDEGAATSGGDVPESKRSPKIVGGQPTTIEEWPWQAAVTQNPFPPASNPGNGFDRQFCGGSLVAPTIVITAAHCTFEVFGSSGFDDPVNFASITGRTTLSSSQGQESAWSDFHFFVDGSGNPLYNPNTSEWDVVFAELATPSPSTTIAIAGANEANAWAPGDENAFATGWGTLISGGTGPLGKQDALREVQIDMIADSVCSSPTSYGSGFFPETMVCAGEVAGGQDTCQGDSGGPLVVSVGAGVFRLVGDTSFGLGCALPGFPGIYGRVAQDPMCTALRNGIQAEAGVDVVGPGGCRAAPDTAAPDTQITKGPKNKTKKKKATFEFTSTEPGATFNCTVDGKEPKAPCTSPFKVKVKKGRHTFAVSASDAAGNVDASPATDSWKRKKKKRKK
jgi:secreted trypsin-like serine protease